MGGCADIDYVDSVQEWLELLKRGRPVSEHLFDVRFGIQERSRCQTDGRPSSGVNLWDEAGSDDAHLACTHNQFPPGEPPTARSPLSLFTLALPPPPQRPSSSMAPAKPPADHQLERRWEGQHTSSVWRWIGSPTLRVGRPDATAYIEQASPPVTSAAMALSRTYRLPAACVTDASRAASSTALSAPNPDERGKTDTVGNLH